MTGGAILGALIGAALGCLLSIESHDLGPVAAAFIGAWLGICMGIGWGAIVQSTDDAIRDVIESLRSK